MAFMWTDMPDIPDTDYRSKGVHKQRSADSKMTVDAMDRNGVTDSEKQAAMEAAAAATAAQVKPASISVDEKVAVGTGNKDIAQEHMKGVAATAAEHVSNVEPGQYLPPTPGSGKPSSYGSGTGPEDNDAQQMGMGIAQSQMGGGGGMGGMQGLPQMIGQDIAAIDDTKDQADDALFEDETVRKAHQQLGERLQGR